MPNQIALKFPLKGICAIPNFCATLAFVLGLNLTHASAEETCSLGSPPRSAAADEDHGIYLFWYPREVFGPFTGCQTLWYESGKKVVQLRFERGQIVGYWDEDVAGGSCTYAGGKLSRQSAKQCPAFELVKDLKYNRPPGKDFAVPKEHDLRLKSGK